MRSNRSMEGGKRKGYAWALSAGFNAALAAISVKLPLHQFVRYGMVLLFNVTMWACYVNSLKALSSLQATVTNFATNFISSGLAGFFFFHESLSFQSRGPLGFSLFIPSADSANAKLLNHQRTHAFYAFSFLIHAFSDAKTFPQWFAGAILIIIGVVILSNSSIEKKVSTD
ncbi:hypothetical protein JHK86_021086 [Glycine max]|nr:hypothetical protein JHK86_021086 [Glycine max]